MDGYDWNASRCLHASRILHLGNTGHRIFRKCNLTISTPGLRAGAFLVFLWVLGALPWAHAAPVQPEWRFVHNGQESASDLRYTYHWAVLTAALDATRAQYGPYTLESVDFMSEARQAAELALPAGRINAMVLDSTSEMERDFLPVKIPVDKGLLGYRVFLIRAEDQTRFARVKSLDDLRQFSMGQGQGWSDVAIYRYAGFQVETGSSYEGLFGMLMDRRFDAFGRGVTEAMPEMASHQQQYPAMLIEKRILLYYPMPVYFWFPKGERGARYAQRVEKGMKIISANGTLDRMFKKEFGPLIRSLHMKDRLLLRIPNPDLPQDQPFGTRGYWFNPLQ
jgi:ABC-type amino acid transport substrate-binding protein